jgi:hypothetical protein
VSPAARLLRALVRGYQLLARPLLPASCRFIPGCSDYAREALARHGTVRGGWLAVRRLCRCHPWGGFGYDPVPGDPLVARLDARERRAPRIDRG